MPNDLPLVSFDVLVRAPKGRSREPGQSIDALRPDPEAIERCRRWLAAHGITCHTTTFGIACSAPGRVFAELFRVEVTRNPKAGPEQPSALIKGEIQVPAEIDELVDQVTLTRPPEYFT